MDLQTWGVIFGPRGVPDAVQQKLNAAINAILMQPAMAEQRRKLARGRDAGGRRQGRIGIGGEIADRHLADER